MEQTVTQWHRVRVRVPASATVVLPSWSIGSGARPSVKPPEEERLARGPVLEEPAKRSAAATEPASMSQVVIENPVLNTPYEEPRRHFRFSETGITNEVVESRRTSSYFVPIPKARMKGKQRVLFTEWTEDRVKENDFINRIRGRVAVWRGAGSPGITKTTRRLLDYWNQPEREKPLFYCQVEALETVIFLTEAASKMGENWIENDLRQFSEDANPGIYRLAIKMATGSGKTVVMAMLIAWQALNKLANPQDARFSDTFLIVTPGITIRDRLSVRARGGLRGVGRPRGARGSAGGHGPPGPARGEPRSRCPAAVRLGLMPPGTWTW